MVRQGKRCRSRGRSDSGLHSIASHSVEPQQVPINISPSPEAMPPLSSSRKPIPNSAFQTTHFKFQSNLNRPLITAQITIILLEEENQVSPLACIAPDPSQSSEHSMDKDSPENWKNDKSGKEEIRKIIPPLEDISPVVEEGTLGAISHSMVIPISEMDGNESLRTNSVCLVKEKTTSKVKEV